jgi:hypothetical protein
MMTAAAQAGTTAIKDGRVMILLCIAKFNLVLISRRSLHRVAALQPHCRQLSSERGTVTTSEIQDSLAL